MLMPRGFVRLGDVVTGRGKVVAKRPSKDGDGPYLVEFELGAENQKEKVITDTATAALISRG
jgi:acyl dehydratase